MMMKKEDSNFNGETASMLTNNIGGCFSQLVNKELESRLPDSHRPQFFTQMGITLFPDSRSDLFQIAFFCQIHSETKYK